MPDALYQSNSDYTWSPPEMSFVDEGAPTGRTCTYEVSTVNWSDLESERSAPLEHENETA